MKDSTNTKASRVRQHAPNPSQSVESVVPKSLPRPVAVVRSKSKAEKEAAAWIESINPLRGMTIAHAQSIFDAARRGNDVRLQWVYTNMEQVDPTLLICAERRSGALIDLDWTIRPKAAKRIRGFDQHLADEQVACLEAAFGDAEECNLVPAIEHLATAFFRGHAHVLPIYTPDGTSLKGFDCLDAWNVCRDLVTGQWHWNPTATEVLDFRTLPIIPPGELCTLVRPRHVDYPAMAIYLRAALGEKAWGQFLERYGVPPVIITMPPDIDPSRVEEYRLAAEKVADGGVGALPNGSAVTYATEARGTNPFKEFLEHQQQLVVLMATGGMLTSLTGATGIGQGASDAHEETWRMIVRRDASAIATAINRAISDALLDRCFPGKPHLAQFDFETEPAPGPDEVFDIAAKAVAAGYRVTRDELEERTGFHLTDTQGFPSPLHPTATQGVASQMFLNKADPVPSCVVPGWAHPPSPRSERSEPLHQLAKALQSDLSPVAEALQELIQAPSPEKARALISRLPDLLPDDPEMAAILETELATTFADTLIEGEELKVETEEKAVANSQQCETCGKFAPKDGVCAKHDKSKADSTESKEKSHAQQQIGKTGNWKSLSLKAGRDIQGDKPEDAIFVEEAREIIKRGDTVTNPLGETLAIDERTYKHINKKGRSQREVEARLREYPQMKACVSNPHEIWEDDATGRRKYIQFLNVNGHKVINAVDEDKDHIVSWHSNTRNYDHYREGKLLYVREGL